MYITIEEFLKSVVQYGLPTNGVVEGYAKLKETGHLSAEDYLKICGDNRPAPDIAWMYDRDYNRYLQIFIKENGK